MQDDENNFEGGRTTMALHKSTVDDLKELMFDFRVDSLEKAVLSLIDEHRKKVVA